MRSDEVSKKVVSIAWDRVKADSGPMDDSFYGVVRIGETELKRFKISKNDYASDRCSPCESYSKRMRDEIAKEIRAEYGE